MKEVFMLSHTLKHSTEKTRKYFTWNSIRCLLRRGLFVEMNNPPSLFYLLTYVGRSGVGTLRPDNDG